MESSALSDWYKSRKGLLTGFFGAIYFVLDHWGRGEAALEIYHILPKWFDGLSPWIAPVLFLLALVFFEHQRRSGGKTQGWKLIAYLGAVIIVIATIAMIVLTPDLHAEISAALIGEEKSGDTSSCVLRLVVKNSGMPTTLDGWQATMKLMGGRK